MDNKIAAIFKFVLFILLLPVVVGTTVGFVDELSQLPNDLAEVFYRGILFYLLMHIFIVEPKGVFQYGQNVVSSIFKFFAPLVKIAPFVLPIYSFLFLILFYFSSLFFDSRELAGMFMLLVSFTLTMHVVFAAQMLRESDSNAAKPNYFFSISLIYVLNAFLLALMFDLILTDFSFSKFFETLCSIAGGVYSAVFRQLFVP